MSSFDHIEFDVVKVKALGVRRVRVTIALVVAAANRPQRYEDYIEPPDRLLRDNRGAAGVHRIL